MISVFSGMSQSLKCRQPVCVTRPWRAGLPLNQITKLQITGEYPDAGNRHDQVEMAHMDWVYATEDLRKFRKSICAVLMSRLVLLIRQTIFWRP